VVLTDACSWGNEAAGKRSLETMKFIGEAILTDTKTFAAGISAS
jgi:hypothetical protein